MNLTSGPEPMYNLKEKGGKIPANEESDAFLKAFRQRTAM